ncbi:hypothetical protein F5878DRAFT_633385 [Lentinula raphanica]|uniref:GPI anchored protein n=1 Tax=Lentinula raphanica TaxID=153919 RepID=A0AA38NYW5_9AGAR|nr:hypothetical protein C8R42DRAFT_675385 [Lentinula raphanica]KAJ3833167.1 hypothetical protein F5878DRAFT_633385 [Lentinula raphanica]
MSLLRNTLFHLLVLLGPDVWAYPQQTTTSSTQTVISTSTVTAILQTIDLDGYNLGGLTLSGFEQDFTTISVIGISTGTDSDGKGESETTYSREIIVSDAVLTVATDGSVVPETFAPGYISTDIETIVENASGYYIDNVDSFTSGTDVLSEGAYITCSFADSNAASAGCSESDYLRGPSTTTYRSLQYSASVGATTMTLPVQVVATTQVSSSSTSGGGGVSQSNGGIPHGIGRRSVFGMVSLICVGVGLV